MRALVLLLCLLVAACGVTMKPGTEPRNRRDIPPGPGILSGDEGEFVIYRVKRTPPAKKTSDKEGEEDEADDTGAQ